MTDRTTWAVTVFQYFRQRREVAAGWAGRHSTKEVSMTTTHRHLLLRIVVIVTIKVKIKLIRK